MRGVVVTAQDNADRILFRSASNLLLPATDKAGLISDFAGGAGHNSRCIDRNMAVPAARARIFPVEPRAQ